MKKQNFVKLKALAFLVVFAGMTCPTSAQHLGMEFSEPAAPVIMQSNGSANLNKFEQQRNLIIDLFSFLDEYEVHFREMKYLNVLGKLPELKTRFTQAQNTFRRYEPRMSEELKILGSIYSARYQIFAGMGDVLKNLRIDSGYRAALLRSATFVLNNYNQLLDKLKDSSGFTPAELGELKLEIANLTRRNQKYSITSKYLSLAENKIPKGEKIIVLEIKDKKALVLYMGPTMTNMQIEDWISIGALEKRTDWVKSNLDYYR